MKPKPCIGFALAVFVWATVFSPEWVTVVGSVVLLHELSHVMMCRFLGVGVCNLRAVPWGVTAVASVMYRSSTQFVVSAAGPATNFLLLGLCPLLEKIFSSRTVELFALANLADGFLNLIPALPLDGGAMLKSLLCSRFGLVRGFSYAIRITAVVGALVMILGIHILWITGSNISYLVAGGFIIYNLRHEREHAMSLRKKLLTGEICSLPAVKVLTLDSSSHALRLVDILTVSHTTVFRVVEEGRVLGCVSQKRLVDCVIRNTMITLGECIEKS